MQILANRENPSVGVLQAATGTEWQHTMAVETTARLGTVEDAVQIIDSRGAAQRVFIAIGGPQGQGDSLTLAAPFRTARVRDCEKIAPDDRVGKTGVLPYKADQALRRR